MKLTGTTKERIEQIIAFSKAHRAYEYEKIPEIYKKAGVPYTEAAEKFCREWCGALNNCRIYPDRPNVVMGDGTKYIIDVDITFNLITDDDDLRYWYDPEYAESKDDWYAECAKWVREKYGAETVPVAEGGYYYPRIIWICPGGKLVTILPDDGPSFERIYDNMFDYLCDHLGENDLSRIEAVRDWKDLEGTMDERIASAIEYAKAHGGFKRCRLFAEMYSRAPLDLSKLTENGDLSDDAAAALLLQILQDTPRHYEDTPLPCRISFVEE